MKPSRPAWALAALIALYLTLVTADPSLWLVFGVAPAAPEPFSPFYSKLPAHLDWWAVVTASDVHQAGLDPLRENPLDPLCRPHVYSRWWYALGYLGMDRLDAPWSAWLLVLTFLGLAWFRLEVREPGGFILGTLLLFSPACMLAVERANNDLVIFVLLVAMRPLLARGSIPGMVAAWWLVALATGLKFYPAILFGVFPAVRRGRAGWMALGAGLAGTGLFLWYYRADVAILQTTMPKPVGGYVIGAPELFRLMDWSWESSRLAGLGVLGLMAAVWIAGRYRSWRQSHRNLDPVEIDFLLGAVTFLGCYALNTNYVYRLVFLLLCQPWLAREWANPTSWRRSWMLTTALLFLLILAWIELPLMHGWLAGWGFLPRLTVEDLRMLCLVRSWFTWAPVLFLCGCTLDLLGPNLWPGGGRTGAGEANAQPPSVVHPPASLDRFR